MKKPIKPWPRGVVAANERLTKWLEEKARAAPFTSEKMEALHDSQAARPASGEVRNSPRLNSTLAAARLRSHKCGP